LCYWQYQIPVILYVISSSFEKVWHSDVSIVLTGPKSLDAGTVIEALETSCDVRTKPFLRFLRVGGGDKYSVTNTIAIRSWGPLF
jgi:hypothetical protein